MGNCRSLDPIEDHVQVDFRETDCEQAPFVYYRGRKFRILQKTIITKSRIAARCLSSRWAKEGVWTKSSVKQEHTNLLYKLLKFWELKMDPASKV